jgi:hypothetical protein
MRCMRNEYSDISGVIQSVLISDYQRTNRLPSINDLLDWRLRLVELKAENKRWVEYPEGWFDKEIAATDYLISLHSV